jgi:hypothetical protein
MIGKGFKVFPLELEHITISNNAFKSAFEKLKLAIQEK